MGSRLEAIHSHIWYPSTISLWSASSWHVQPVKSINILIAETALVIKTVLSWILSNELIDGVWDIIVEIPAVINWWNGNLRISRFFTNWSAPCFWSAMTTLVLSSVAANWYRWLLPVLWIAYLDTWIFWFADLSVVEPSQFLHGLRSFL